MTREGLGDRPDRRGEHADEVGVVLREAQPRAAGGRARPHRQALLLGQGHGVIPRPRGVDVRPGDQDRIASGGQPARERGQRLGIRGGAPADAASQRTGGAVGIGLGVPVIHRDRDERRSPRRQRRVVDRPGQRAGDILGPRRLVAPLDIGLGPDDGVAVGQVGLDRDLGPDLLAGGDHQRRLVGLRVEDGADGVADPGGGVEVDMRGATAGLRVAVGHAHHDELLQAEHVGEVLREVGEHRQLGRAGVAEDRGHPVRPEQIERRFADSGHLVVLLLS